MAGAQLTFWKPRSGSARLIFGEQPGGGPAGAQLTFRKPRSGSARLIFGEQPGGGPAGATLALDAALDDGLGPVAIQYTPAHTHALAADAAFDDPLGTVTLLQVGSQHALAADAEFDDPLGTALLRFKQVIALPPLQLDAAFDADFPAVCIAFGRPVSIDAEFAEALGIGVIGWDPYVSRGPRHFAAAPHQDARAARHAPRDAVRDAEPRRHWRASHLRDASAQRAALAAWWMDAARLAIDARSRLQDAAAARTAAPGLWMDSLPIRAAAAGQHWQDARAARASVRGHYQDNDRRRHAAIVALQDANTLRRAIASPLAPAIPGRIWQIVRYQDARRPPPGKSPPRVIVDPNAPVPCWDPDHRARLIFEAAWSGTGQLVFICRRAAPDPGPDPEPGHVVIPVKRVYVVLNEIDLRRVDGNLPLHALGLSMALDVDSWTWQWSATLPGQSLQYLAPAQAGEPVAVEASINGVAYRLLAERVRRSRQFPATRVEVSGRGLAAALDAPYAPVLDFNNAAAARSAHQLMIDALTINAVPIGWSIDWSLTDWQVPAGAWAHQGTYISAVSAIAAAAGGYVQPHATQQTLRILPRYPAAPWDWAGIVPDVDMPMDPVSVEGVEWITRPDYNRVFVSGTGQGVLGRVTRTGTAGDLLAPMVADPLITHADAASQRGRAILADTGSQAIVTLTLPVLPETGLILPGRFVRRTDGAEVLQGLVRGLRLDYAAPRLRQTIEVQTHG